jgi:hypothetical protein
LNIPDDGQWILKYDSMSPTKRLRRVIQDKKFYATLPAKLDAAELKWLKKQPDEPELDWHFEEVGEFGKEGWTISYSHKSVNND